MRRTVLAVIILSMLVSFPPLLVTAQAGCVSYGDYIHALDVIYPAGYLRSMVYQAPYLYVINDESLLTILDAEDPANLQEMGSLGLPTQPSDIDVRESIAYLTYSYSDELQLVDISNPHAPQALGSALIPGNPQAVAATNAYAYVPACDYGEDNHGLYVVDITKPSAPTVIDRVELGLHPHNVIVSEPYAFVIDYSDLWILDISTPHQPKPIGSVNIPGAPAYLATRDEYVFVVCDASEESKAYGNGLYMINISDPANPWIEGIYDAEGAPSYHVGLWEQYAIVGTFGAGFAFIDISDPTNMQIVDSIGMQMTPGDFAIDGSILFARSYSIASYKLLDPLTPGPVASVPETENSRIIVSQDDYVYTVHDHDEFCVVDVSNPGNPFKVGSEILNLDYSGDIALAEINRGELFAYVAEGGDNDGFHVLDINDPTDPEPVNFFPLGHSPADLDVEGNYLYMTAGYLGLLTYDITNPVEPGFISSLGFTYSVNMLTAVGSMLYVGRRSGTGSHTDLFVIDAADPYDLQIVGTSSDPELPYDFWVEGPLLYIADGWGGLLIMDIGDPENPTPISRLRTGTMVKALVVEDGIAYLADTRSHSGLHLVDVSDPASPFLVGYYPCSYPCDLNLINGHVLIASYNENLEVAPLECESSLVPDDLQAAWAGFGMSIRPNPSFNHVSVRLMMPAKENARLTVHDVQGRLIDQLHRGPLSAGTHHFQWDGRRRDGGALPVGVYYLRYLSGRVSKSKSIVLVR